VKAAEARVDIIMLDNFSREQIGKTIAFLKEKKAYGEILLEASGGITKENAVTIASTGVDLISLGEITNSSKALDVNLKIVVIRKNDLE